MMQVDTIDPETLWVADADGKFDVCPFLSANAKIMNRGAGYLIAYVRSPEHLQAVKDGREPIGTLQLHMTAEQCRREAERLTRCAQALEGQGEARH